MGKSFIETITSIKNFIVGILNPSSKSASDTDSFEDLSIDEVKQLLVDEESMNEETKKEFLEAYQEYKELKEHK